MSALNHMLASGLFGLAGARRQNVTEQRNGGKIRGPWMFVTGLNSSQCFCVFGALLQQEVVVGNVVGSQVLLVVAVRGHGIHPPAGAVALRHKDDLVVYEERVFAGSVG